MKSFAFCRFGLTIGAASVILAGCGGAQNTALGAMPASATAGKAAEHKGSGPSGDLLYVTTGEKIDVFSYPAGQYINTIHETHGMGDDATSDPNNGNVFFNDGGAIIEYAHGGSVPIATIMPPYQGQFFDVAIDPTTDAIAATLYDAVAPGKDGIAIYASPTATPTIYSDPDIRFNEDLTFDNTGNVYVDGLSKSGSYVLAELPKGSNTFMAITLTKQPRIFDNLFWDGTYLGIMSLNSVFKVSVSGSVGTVVRKVQFRGLFAEPNLHYRLQGTTLLGNHRSGRPHNGRFLGFWNYSKSGEAFKLIRKAGRGEFYPEGLAVSVASSH